MILRKPYALLIKNFRLIHVIMAILAGYLFLRGNDILNFLGDYISNNGILIESFTIKELFPTSVVVCFTIILLFNIIMIWLFYIKEKKVLFYIINTIFYIALAFLFYSMYTTANEMQINLIDTKTIRALRDFFVMASAVQAISIFMYGFRATGFDIKKFDFGKDLVDLDIIETDNEEFEVDVNIDINRINRESRKTLRYLKYFYFENKLVSNAVIIVFCLISTFVLYQIFQDKRIKYDQFQPFFTNDYELKIGNGYITNQDKNRVTISKINSYVIIEVYIRKTNNYVEKMNTTRFELIVGDNKYYHDYEYSNYFNDIGTSYYDEKLSNEFSKYLLVYKVKTKELSKKMYLNYVDASGEVVVNVDFEDLGIEKQPQIYAFAETIDFKNTILDNYKLTVTPYEIKKEFAVNYSYCISNDCINAVEYIKPNISSNYNKAILKVKANLEIPELKNEYVTSFKKMCNNFGEIKYTIDGKTYLHKLTMDMIEPTKIKQENIYYIEVKEEVLNASNVSLLFTVRNKTYEYVIK